MQKDSLNLIESKLRRDLRGILFQYEDERVKSNTNLVTISKTHDNLRDVQPNEISNHFKTKLRDMYQSSIRDADNEVALLKKALETIYNIRDISYQKKLQSNKEEGPDSGALLKLVWENRTNLPLWVGKKNESPPPLCGAIPAAPNYIAKIGDLVAALVEVSDDDDDDPEEGGDDVEDSNENWILAEVTGYNHNTNKYEVDDIYEQKSNHVLSRQHVIPLPLMKANPETNPEALFPQDTLVLALYPQTTCFYHSIVKTPPNNSQEEYELLFKDTSFSDGYSPTFYVAQRYVICFRENTK